MAKKNSLPQKLSVNQQLLAASAFNKTRQDSKDNDESIPPDMAAADNYSDSGADDYFYNDNALSDAMQSFEHVVSSHRASVAITEGAKLGSHLRSNISNNRFDGSTFLTVLLLSLIKDVCDFADLGAVIGPILNIFITFTLFIVFFLKVSTIKKMLIKWFVWPAIVEFIPFFCTFPSYTVSTILLKIKVDSKIRKLEDSLKEVTGKTANVKKAIKIADKAEDNKSADNYNQRKAA